MESKVLLTDESGFTLMEMIVVLVIIGLLIAGGVSFYSGYIEHSKITKAKSQISVMQGAMDSWYAGQGAYPKITGDQQLAGIDTEAKDPWGRVYIITVESADGLDNSYQIRTGWAQVHQDKVVAGLGKNGRSVDPAVVDAAGTEP